MRLKIILTALLSTLALKAVSMDYLSNNSASYFQNPSQTGKITVEGIFYNPAGTVFLEDGKYINANMQNSIIQESMTLNRKKLASNRYAGAPSFNYLQKKEGTSIFANASVIAGGATLKYDEGVAGIDLAAETFDNMTRGLLGAKVTKNQFSGQNRYYQLMLGGAHKITDKFSIGGGIKYVHALRKLNGHASFGYNPFVGARVGLTGNDLYLDSRRKADGVGAVLGLDYKATDTLNFAVKYETPVKLKFKTKAVESTNMTLAGKKIGLSDFYPKYANGVNSRRDLPGVLSLGVSKDINDWTVSSGYIHYFNKVANIDGVSYRDGHEINFGVDYRFSPKWTWHAGYNYAHTGAPKQSYNDTEYAINAQIYTTGLTFKPAENHEWKFGVGYVKYNSENGETEITHGIKLDKSKVKYDKKVSVFSLGYTYKF